MSIDFILPDIGEGIVECELVEWLVKEGDKIVEDQPIADVMTDKALVQIPAMHSGVIEKLFYKQGEIAKVHAPLFSMKTDSPTVADGANASNESQESALFESATVVKASVVASEVKQVVNTKRSIEPAQEAAKGKAVASPAVRRVARELDVNISDVTGSGKKGRVYKDDVVAFETFNSSSQTSRVTGSVAIEDAVESATACGFFIATKNSTILIFENSFKHKG